MHFLLSSMSVVYGLTTHIPDDGDDATMDQLGKRNKWDNDDYVCRELWNSLEAKYMAEDASSKKFLVSNFINYKMTDSRPVVEQCHELLAYIKKNKKEELTLVKLGSHLRIEESLKAQDSDKPKGNNVAGPHDLRDLHATPSLGNKKYFVTFIDDAFRFCYVYLLDSKDEALDKLKVFKIEVKLHQRSLIKRFRTNRGRFYVIEPNESVSINLIIKSRDAIFDENRFSSVPRPSLRIPNGTKDIGGLVVPEEVIEEDDPKTFDEAMKSQDVAFWKEAINDEMDSIMDGTIEKFKATLFIQGFKQKLGIDYFDTYAPVARISTIRLLIAMASIHNLIIHQMDVKRAFLNEEVYMNQPQGFIIHGNENKVDLIKEFLLSKFSMKDMGEADVILGIRIKHESNGITISQSHYIEKVLKKFNYFDCTPVSTLMNTSEKLVPNNG
nr:hypothetical protein [Tanacetum cinerariifolium]